MRNTDLLLHNTDDGPKGPAPKLGEHNSEILSDIGFTKEEIQEMIKEGIIGKEV